MSLRMYRQGSATGDARGGLYHTRRGQTWPAQQGSATGDARAGLYHTRRGQTWPAQQGSDTGDVRGGFCHTRRGQTWPAQQGSATGQRRVLPHPSWPDVARSAGFSADPTHKPTRLHLPTTEDGAPNLHPKRGSAAPDPPDQHRGASAGEPSDIAAAARAHVRLSACDGQPLGAAAAARAAAVSRQLPLQRSGAAPLTAAAPRCPSGRDVPPAPAGQTGVFPARLAPPAGAQWSRNRHGHTPTRVRTVSAADSSTGDGRPARQRTKTGTAARETVSGRVCPTDRRSPSLLP